MSSLKDTGALEHSDLFIINHLSVEPETALYLEEIKASLRATVIDYDGVFNFSYMNNLAVNKLPRPYDYYLFLNNDVYATTPGWLESMLDIAVRKDIGIVGATLLYPKGTVQHAGVVVGPMGIATHAHYMKPFYASADTPVENNWDVSLFCVADYSAVTAAAMLVKADAFRRVGGYDESLQVGFGDTGLCLSVGRLGLGVVNTPDAVLYHHESASRGRPEYGVDDHWRDTLRFRQKYADIFTHADPYHNTLLAMHQLNPLLQSLRRCRVACNTRTVDVNIHQN